MPPSGVTTRKSFGSKFAIRTGCGRLLSASCGNSNPKSSRLENVEQILRVMRRGALVTFVKCDLSMRGAATWSARVALLARDGDARRIASLRLGLRFRETL